MASLANNSASGSADAPGSKTGVSQVSVGQMQPEREENHLLRQQREDAKQTPEEWAAVDKAR